MDNWIGMGFGFLLGYIVALFKRKIFFNLKTFILPPTNARISKQEKAIYKKRKVYILSVLAIFALATTSAIIVFNWILKTTNLSVFSDFVMGFLVFIIPGLCAGLLVSRLIEKFTN